MLRHGQRMKGNKDGGENFLHVLGSFFFFFQLSISENYNSYRCEVHGQTRKAVKNFSMSACDDFKPNEL
jgi:hypothetical protein